MEVRVLSSAPSPPDEEASGEEANGRSPEPCARPGEFAELRLGASLRLAVPVVLAPMAGVTNPAYRRLCREFGEGLFVGEMLAARALVERKKKTLALLRFYDGERPRSVQLQAYAAADLEEAARYLVAEHGLAHLDLNLGCPVRKITSNGGGSAIPARPELCASFVAALVRGARGVPVTVKMRLGLDEERLTYLEAGRIAQEEGAVGVALHARTAAQFYDGKADWARIAELVSLLDIPVLGNGDVFEAADALRMMRQTRCAGVVIGRGCLGRPWLFGELGAAFRGEEAPPPPTFGEVRAIALRHARLLVDLFGERAGMLHMRKFANWYVKSFPGSSALRAKLARVASIQELAALLGIIPDETSFPTAGVRARRAKRAGVRKVHLPEGWLEV